MLLEKIGQVSYLYPSDRAISWDFFWLWSDSCPNRMITLMIGTTLLPTLVHAFYVGLYVLVTSLWKGIQLLFLFLFHSEKVFAFVVSTVLIALTFLVILFLIIPAV